MEKKNIRTGLRGELINLILDFLINENLSFQFTVYYAIINHVLTTFACKHFKARTMQRIKKKISKVNHNFYFFNSTTIPNFTELKS